MTAPMLYRTASAMTLALAIAAAPAVAQETAAPPLVIQPAPAPIPAPQVATPVPQAATPAPQIQTPPPVASVPDVAEEAPAPAARTRAARPAPRAVAPRAAPAPATVQAAPAPAAAAPAPAAPVEAAPVDVTPAPVAEVPATAPDTATTTTTETAAPTWPWLAGALVLIAAIGAFFLMRRRRTEDEVYYEQEAVVAEPVYAEPAYVEPAAAAMPMTAPIVADRVQDEIVEEQAELVTADADEVAAITATDAPAGRPWIELSFRPVRAGATEDSATVDVELTLGNAGDVAAKNVRVSTFMLGDQADAPTQMERLLATDHTGTDVDAGRIEPGEGSRVDATLSVARDTMSGGSFSPVVVADVRYDLPNGGEGRTAASFVVGATAGEDSLVPIQLGGDIREDVGAALHGELERA